ncbi:MAG: nucleoside triphosphate pyrophosphatase [Pseudomonadota bacterium]
MLASASPRRLDLLRQIGVEPGIIDPADIDETPKADEPPRAYVARLALDKAKTVAARHPDALVLAADTVVYAGRRIFDKPTDAGSAKACLRFLSGRRHRVATAVALIRGPDGRSWTRLVETQVRFKRLSSLEIETYLSGGEWRGKAGGYAIQGQAAAFVPAINGSYSNVVGLPLAEVSGMLEAAGYGLRSRTRAEAAG